MGKTYAELDARLQQFIMEQRVYFVATAPLAADGHVNLSPKGLDGTLAILDKKTIAYLDFTGSAAETIAHGKENGRIVLMFCAFEKAPNIVRVHGRAEVIEFDDDEFETLRRHFGPSAGVRAIIRVHAERISDSCGFGVPLYEFKGHRKQLPAWVQRKGPDGIAAYQDTNNTESIDGLPALRRRSNASVDP